MTLSNVPEEMSDLEYSWAASCSGQFTDSINVAKCFLNTSFSFLPLENALDILCKHLAFFFLVFCFGLGILL